MSRGFSTRKGSPYIMIKEIHEQPSIAGSIVNRDSEPYAKASEYIINSRRIFIVGSGSSYHAGLVLGLSLRRIGYNVYEVVSSEYDHIIDLVDEKSTVVALSQSGSTSDTLEAVKAMKSRGAVIISVTNVEKSPLALLSDHTLYVGAGREEAVTATKSFTGQVINLVRIYIEILRNTGREFFELEHDLRDLPKILREHIYRSEVSIRNFIDFLYRKDHMYISGREYQFIASLESSLKIKETCGIHAEALHMGEIRHGPKSIIDENFVIGFLLRDNRDLELSKRIIDEISDSNAIMLINAPEEIETPASDRIFVVRRRSVSRELSLILDVATYQLLSYYIAVARLLDPDYPRRLSKVVI